MENSENTKITNKNRQKQPDEAVIINAIFTSIMQPAKEAFNNFIESNERIERYKIEKMSDIRDKEIKLFSKISNREFILKITVILISLGIILFYTVRGYDLSTMGTIIGFIIASVFANSINGFIKNISNLIKKDISENT